MKRRIWTMLYRREDSMQVCRYEPLTTAEIKELRKEGWKLI